MDLFDQIISWDKQLFIFLNSWGLEILDPFFIAISKTAIWAPLYGIIIFLIFKKFEIKTALVYFSAAILCVVLTDQISVHAFKNVFERLRPCWTSDLDGQFRLVKEYCGGQFGFVSSHAANTFGFATLMGIVFKEKIPNLRWMLFLWAAVISYSRVYLGVHFPLDIIFGGLLGSGIAVAVAKSSFFVEAKLGNDQK